MVSAKDVAEAATTALSTATGTASSEHPRGVLASRRRLFASLPDMKQGSTPLVVTGLFQGYLAYNLARKALAVAAPGLQQGRGEGGLRLSKTDLGLVSSSFTAMYGASKFAGSVITDHVSCRALFSLGLVLTGVLCFVFSLSNDLPRLCALWSIHGIVQGAGWPSLAKLCVERVPPQAQGRVWALLSAAGNAGHVCAGPLLLSLGGGWRRVMRGAGLVALLSGLAAWGLTGDPDEADEWRLLRRREGYEDAREVLLQWTTYEDWRAMVAKMVEWIWVVRRILSLPEVASLFLADSLVYFVIKGLADWSVLALTETKGLGEKEAVGIFFYCELGAIFGSFASGWVSDQVGGLRTSTSSAFALLALPFLYATQHMPLTPHTGLAPLAAAYFLLGLFVNGPKTLSGIALRQLVPPSMAGTAMGVQGLVGQVGASWAGAPVGFVAQHWGWGAIKHLWAASLVAAAGCLSVPGLLVKARRVAATQRERGGKEGPLLKLFNFYLPPTPEEREAAEAAAAKREAAAAAERRLEARANSTLGSLLQRRRRNRLQEGQGGAAGGQEDEQPEGDEQEGDEQEETEQEEQAARATAAAAAASSASSAESALASRWRRRWRLTAQTTPDDDGVDAQEPESEGAAASRAGDEAGEDESTLTLRQRITRRARRMRQGVREAAAGGQAQAGL